jgi:6-pyruvoyltetrahydropterin/6-carboxytetrahydropterin synthase
MFKIEKEFAFSASHQLVGLPEGHQCGRLHGHNYIVVLVLEGDLNDQGFVVDYGDLAPFKAWIDAEWDHRHIGAYTAEQLAQQFYYWAVEHWPQLTAVRVSETPKTWAEYRP